MRNERLAKEHLHSMIRRLLLMLAGAASVFAVLVAFWGPTLRPLAQDGTAELSSYAVGAGGGAGESESFRAETRAGDLSGGEGESESFGASGGFWSGAQCFDDGDGLDDSAEASLGTNICAYDSDGDGPSDAADPCPTNPDCDADGFNDGTELYIGTDPLDNCADNTGDHAWPPDINNDAQITGFDLNALANVIGKNVPPAPARRDIAPQPPDGQITGGDLNAVASRIGRSCSP